MTVILFANGDLHEIDWVRPYLVDATAVIAANGGTTHLWRLDHLPDLVVGDIDSLPAQTRKWLQAADIPFLEAPADKDETDLELALLHAAGHYEEDILVFAAFGGRVDQTLANIILLAHPALSPMRIELLTRHERLWLVMDQTEIEGEIGDTVSLIPLAGDVRVRKTTGLKWPLEDEVLIFGPARGISNVLSSRLASVTLDSGKLLCVHTRRDWDR